MNERSNERAHECKFAIELYTVVCVCYNCMLNPILYSLNAVLLLLIFFFISFNCCIFSFTTLVNTNNCHAKKNERHRKREREGEGKSVKESNKKKEKEMESPMHYVGRRCNCA